MRNLGKNILFVSHKADRSGAPLLLLQIIKEFKKKSTIPFCIIIFNDGELKKEFEALGKTFVWNKKIFKNSSDWKKGFSGFFSRILLILRGFTILFRVRKSSLVFFNTIANGHFHKKLLFLKCRYIYYVHELEAAIQMLTNAKSRQTIFNNTDLFLAVSEAVRTNLIYNHTIDRNIVKAILTPFHTNIQNKKNHSNFINGFQDKKMLSPNTIIIGAVGQNEWRKGFDLFLPLITVYFNLFPDNDVFFIWKGFNDKNPDAFFDNYESSKFDVKKRAIILPHGRDSMEVMASLDIHLLLSREDPYPLVVLEASSFAVPTVCFLDSGGSPEFIEDDCGICVPYGDLFKMSNALNQLVQNKTLRNKLGIRAQEKVKKHEFDKTIPEFIAILESDFNRK